MWSHLDELAPACKAAYLEGKRKFDEDEALRQLELKLSACASEVKKHCGKSAKDAEKLSCLKNKLAKVGNACRKAMEQK